MQREHQETKPRAKNVWNRELCILTGTQALKAKWEKIGYKGGLGTPWKLWMESVATGDAINSIPFLSQSQLKGLRGQQIGIIMSSLLPLKLIRECSFRPAAKWACKLDRITKPEWKAWGNWRPLLQGKVSNHMFRVILCPWSVINHIAVMFITSISVGCYLSYCILYST